MAVVDHQLADAQVERPFRAGKRERAADNLRLDLLVALLAAWFMGGLFLDGWAHNNGRVDDTFFTPWHLVLYSGYAAVGALLVGTHVRNVLRGYTWSRALPRGYMLSLLGVIIFGFEVNLQPLLSPAHLILATGAFLFVSGPLRAALHRSETGWRNLLPALLSLL